MDKIEGIKELKDLQSYLWSLQWEIELRYGKLSKGVILNNEQAQKFWGYIREKMFKYAREVPQTDWLDLRR